MIKKLFQKIYDFIQWTKKWHFCHVFLVGSFATTTGFFIFITILFAISFTPLFGNNISIAENIIAYINLYMLFWLFAFVCLFLPSIFIQIFFAAFNFIKYKKIYITNNFLLNNKIYNLIYVFSFVFSAYLLLFTNAGHKLFIIKNWFR